MIEEASQGDWDWIKPLLDPAIFGNGGLVWYRFWHTPRFREHWDVIRSIAFVHWRERQDGMRIVEEIAVHPDVRRQGYGRVLMEHVGKPVHLKTDHDNQASNAFYRKLGLSPMYRTRSRNGRKELVTYQAY